MKVSKEFTFHAAHYDADAPVGDQCRRLHGHTYTLRLTVEGKCNSRGMVLHGNALKQFYKNVIEPRVEHEHLNETLAPLNPTMERVLQFVTDEFVNYIEAGGPGGDLSNLRRVEVRLWETPTMFAEEGRSVSVVPF